MVSSGGVTGTVCDSSAVSSAPHAMVLTNSSLSMPVGKFICGTLLEVRKREKKRNDFERYSNNFFIQVQYCLVICYESF